MLKVLLRVPLSGFSVEEREVMVEEQVPSYWECFSNFCQQTILHGWHYLTVSQAQPAYSSCCCPSCPASQWKPSPSLLDFSLTNLSEQETSAPPGSSSSQQQQQQHCSITRTHCQARLYIPILYCSKQLKSLSYPNKEEYRPPDVRRDKATTPPVSPLTPTCTGVSSGPS